jgi:cytochrome c-type biogenesis protein CcmH/NrfF
LENLQLLTAKENSQKSRIEVKLLCYVCVGQMPLAQAQQEIAGGWREAYRRYSGQKCGR